MVKRIIFLPLFLLFFLFTVSTVSAASNAVSRSYRERVLGASTVNLQIPPTSEGPGLILPDSPLFFLDNLKQNVRLFFAYTEEEKAKTHLSIAGERLAELRFMLAKNNKDGVGTALSGISNNLQKASDDLKQAQLTGKNVSVLAKEINDDIRSKQQSLDTLENQSKGEMKAQVAAAQEGLVFAKVKTEDALSKDDLKSEITYDLNRQVQRQVSQSSEISQSVGMDLDELTKEASEAALNSQKNREEALKKAIDEKNQTLQSAQQGSLENEKNKNIKLMKLEADEAAQVMETVKKAQEAAVAYQKIRQSVTEVRNQNPETQTPKALPTPTPAK